MPARSRWQMFGCLGVIASAWGYFFALDDGPEIYALSVNQALQGTITGQAGRTMRVAGYLVHGSLESGGSCVTSFLLASSPNGGRSLRVRSASCINPDLICAGDPCVPCHRCARSAPSAHAGTPS